MTGNGKGMSKMDDEKNHKLEDTSTSPIWDKINDEAEMLRSRTTPAYMKQRIMDALPEKPEPAKPWYKRVLDK
ncbi:hypothetical protein BH23GEM1_BH23GEM1_06120 [soil metagenome]